MRTPEAGTCATANDLTADGSNRRRLVSVASAALAVPSASVAAQQAGGTPEAGTPVASPVASARSTSRRC